MSDNDSETLQGLIDLNDSADTPEDVLYVEQLIEEYENADRSAAQQKSTMEQLTQQAAAWLVSMTGRHLRDAQPPRNRDQTYNGPELVQWAIGQRVEAATGGGLAEDSRIQIDLLKGRIEKLKHENHLAELKIGERNQRLVDRAVIEQNLAAQAAMIRSSLEKLERQFGPEALDIVIEALDEAAQMDLLEGSGD